MIPTEPDPAADSRLVSYRRRRIARALGVMVIGGAAVVLVSMVNRDNLAVAADRKRLEFWRDEFTAMMSAGRSAPLDLPVPRGKDAKLRESYSYNVMYVTTARTHGRAAVVYRNTPLLLFLRAGGRHILTFDGDRYEIVWVNQKEFTGLRPQLGLP